MSGSGPGAPTCPSGRCREGSVLLGVVTRNGRLGYVSTPLIVDTEFVIRARAGPTPESWFRFAEPCVEDRCDHWSDGACGLIGQLLSTPAGGAVTAAPVGMLPRCTIRRTCRWYAQRGGQACAICPHVVNMPSVAVGQPE